MAVLGLLISWLIPGCIIGVLDNLAIRRPNRMRTIGSIIVDTIAVDLLTMLITRFVFNNDGYFVLASYRTWFVAQFMATALIVGAIVLVFKFAFRGVLRIDAEGSKYSVWRIIAIVCSLIAATLGAVLGFGSWWYRDFIGALTPEQMMFNFFSPISGGENGAVNDIFARPVLLAVSVVAFLAFLMLAPITVTWHDRTIIRNTWVKTIASMLAIAVLIAGAVYSWNSMHLKKVWDAYNVKSTYIADNYVRPSTKNVHFPHQKRNLIHIYFESAENSYLDKANGGYMDENLMPDLMAFADEGAVHFSHTDTFGGPHQIYGSSWSTAGMTNMNFGVPLKVPTDGNSYGLDGKYLPGAIGYTDLLYKQGYNETVMFGADADFGGLTAFYSTHGTQKIFDHQYAIKQGLIPPNYKVWWGYEDNKLYEYAKTELTRLAGEGKPFAFIMENADSHFPDGYMEPETEHKFEQQYANVIFHSQKQITQFIRWIQSQPFYKNTSIVVTGDHLSMDKKFFVGWDPQYERTTFNMFINPAFDEAGDTNIKMHQRQYAPFDYFPTIMASLGVKITGDRLGLGTNLASNTPTLIERDGLKHVDYQLSLYSEYYAKDLLEMPNAGLDRSGRTVHSRV